MPWLWHARRGPNYSASSHIKLRPMQRALYHKTFQFSPRERPTNMCTTIVDRVVAAIDIRDENFLPCDLVTLHHAWWKFRCERYLYPTISQFKHHSLLASSSQLFLKTCSSNYAEVRGSCLQSDSRQDF